MTPPPMCATDGAPAGPGLPPLPGPAPRLCPLSYPIGTLRRRWHRSPPLQRRPPPRRRSGSCRPPTTPQRGHRPRSARHDPPRDGPHPDVAPPRARAWPTTLPARPACGRWRSHARAWHPRGVRDLLARHRGHRQTPGRRKAACPRRRPTCTLASATATAAASAPPGAESSLSRWSASGTRSRCGHCVAGVGPKGGEHVPQSARAAGASVASLTPNSSSALRRSPATSISSCATAHRTISRRPWASTSKLKRLELARSTPARGAASPLGERPPPRLALICR